MENVNANLNNGNENGNGIMDHSNGFDMFYEMASDKVRSMSRTMYDLLRNILNKIINIPQTIKQTGKNFVKTSINFAVHETKDFFSLVLEVISQSFLNCGINLTKIPSIITLLNASWDFIMELINLPIVITRSGLSSYNPLSFYRRLIVFSLEMYKHIKEFLSIENDEEEEYADAQSNMGGLDSAVTLLFSYFLIPKPVFNALKDFSILTNFKILDETTWFFDVISFIMDFPLKLLKTIGYEGVLIDVFFTFSMFFPLGKMSRYQAKFNCLENNLKVKKWNFSEDDLEKCKNIIEEFETLKSSLLERRRALPDMFVQLGLRVKKLETKYMYKINATRTEPVCCVFVGPAGTGKSTLLSHMINSYSQTVYKHACQNQDKDFYDQYDNEDIFVMDDIGQKGVHQWSDVINMVSTVPYPLNCADVDLKGTKYFTSKLMLMTTNTIDLTLTPQCGLTTLSALHRRLMLADFSKCVFEHGCFFGSIDIKKYNLRASRYETIKTLDCSIGNSVDLPISEIAKAIDDILYKEMVSRKVRLEALQHKTELKGVPQNYELPNKMSLLKSLVFGAAFFSTGIFYDLFVEQLALDLQLVTYNAGLTVIATIVFGVGAMLVNKLNEWINSEEPIAKTKEFSNKYYRSGRTKQLTILEALPESLEEVFNIPENKPVSNLEGFSNNVVGIKASFMRKGLQYSTESLGFMSGQYLMMTLHSVLTDEKKNVLVTVYTRPHKVYYDNLPMELIYESEVDDVAVLKIPDRMAQYFRKRDFPKDSKNINLYMLLPGKQYNLEEQVEQSDCAISYKRIHFPDRLGKIEPLDSIQYDVQSPSLCGAPIVTADGMLVGHHVAYIASKNKGVAKLFSKETLRSLHEFFQRDNKFYLEVTRDQKTEGSVVDLQIKAAAPPMSKTKFVESSVSGIFPKERVPANLENSVDKLKIASNKANVICKNPNINALKFATKVVSHIVEGYDFRILTEEEIVRGTDFLGKLDKDTSCGYMNGKKQDYIDFENNQFLPEFRNLINKVEKMIIRGEYPVVVDGINATMFQEQLKDELRDVEKKDNPRLFKMSSVVHTVLVRKYLGSLLEHIHKNRSTNGIAVGINPYSEEWEDMLRRMLRVSRLGFDGDYGKYDKYMNMAFQSSLNRVIENNSDNNSIVSFLLGTVSSSITVSAFNVIMTTHSLPSGVGVTAEYNSLIGVMYIAYCYYVLSLEQLQVEPTVTQFYKQVAYNTYGDDCIVAPCKDIWDWFNGETFCRVITSLGLEFTPADKTTWNNNNKLRSLFDCTFLKRGFSFNRRLGRVVGPLDKKSMKSTLNFVKDPLRKDELTEIKLLGFQREAFLHEDYREMMEEVKKYCDKHFPVKFCPEDELIDSFIEGDYNPYLELS